MVGIKDSSDATIVNANAKTLGHSTLILNNTLTTERLKKLLSMELAQEPVRDQDL